MTRGQKQSWERRTGAWLRWIEEWGHRGIAVVLAWQLYEHGVMGKDNETVMQQIVTALCGLGVLLVLVAVYLVDVRSAIRRAAADIPDAINDADRNQKGGE